MVELLKPLEFRGSALADLRTFPGAARREAGFQLDRVQRGFEPGDWKPMATIGQGVREIRIRGEDGAFRIIYVAKFAEAVFVLHCFQKKSQRTSREDITLATQRYKELVRELKS
ncbi:type II toxin-antitoxin system RelE/ParE family toxin [Nitrobacter winogradskyi]|nr:type II toxin-antitoxin system RelE/ParE family toxin [Nitrobacter winogradskyi]